MKLLLATAVILACPLITHAQEKAEAPVEAAAGADQETAAGEPDGPTKALINKVKAFNYQTGSVTLKTRVSDEQQIGALFVPAHFREPQVNQLSHEAFFPLAVTLTKG